MSAMGEFRKHIHDVIAELGVTPSISAVKKYCLDHRLIYPQGSLSTQKGIVNLTLYTENPGVIVDHEMQSTMAAILSTNTNTKAFPTTMVKSIFHQLTDSEILEQQKERFETCDMIIDGVIDGVMSAAVVSGPPGVGKTYSICASLDAALDAGRITSYVKESGHGRATGLFKLLYENKDRGQVLLLDDMDSIFDELTSLNILKAALDTTGRVKMISWRTEKVLSTESGEEIPHSFEYNGSVIFITNIDFEAFVQSGKKNSEHMDAIMSRCSYVSLGMQGFRELTIRIEHVARTSGIFGGIEDDEVDYLLKYIKDNAPKFRELSLRMATKLFRMYVPNRQNRPRFERLVANTEFKRVVQYATMSN